MTNLINSIAEGWFNWQFAMLWQTAVLIGIIWIADVCIRKWAHPQLRYTLWMLILIKLVIGPMWTSPVSVTSRIPGLAQQVVQTQMSVESPPAVEMAAETETELVESETSASDYVPHPTVADSEMPTRVAVAAESEPVDAFGPIETVVSEPVEQAAAAAGLSGKAWMMFVWLAGAAILTGWLVRRLGNLRKEHLKTGDADSAHLPGWFDDLLEKTAGRLNIKHLPRVVLTDKVACPAVFGLLRPVLLIPAGKLKHMTQQDTEHILLHELAHIKRGDLWVHALAMTLQILYWFNPLLWLIRRPLQNLRELCCDATVAKLLKEKTPQYRETLLETARQLLAEPVDPGLGLLGLFENSNWLVTRLQWLEKNTWKNRKLRIVTIFLLVAVMTTCVLPMANRQNTDYMAMLDNGTTVELLAVCQYPSEGKIWWGPDGSPCDMQIETEDTSRYSSDDPGYEFVFRKTGDQHFEVHSVKGANIRSGIKVLNPKGLRGYRIHIKSSYRKADIKIASPSGLWKTVHTSNSPTASTSTTVHGKTIIIAAAVSDGENTIISCSDELLPYKDATRIIAIDPAGKKHTGRLLTDTSVNNIRQRTLRFEGLQIDDVAEVCFQTCSYQYYTFKKVALRPGRDTCFKVTGTVTDAQTGEPIAGADVYDNGYNGGKCRTTTNEAGHFTLLTANEEHNVAAAAEGYESQTKTLLTFPLANNENFDFQLVPNSQLNLAHPDDGEDTEDEYCLLLLDNCDPDFKGKESYEDKLYLLDKELKIKGVLSGLNICENVGGSHALAVDEKRKTAWMVESVADRLWHIDLETGKVLHVIHDMKATSVAVDPENGNAWVLISEGTIYGKELVVYSSNGEPVANYDIHGQDIVYSTKEDCFWLVSDTVLKVNKKGDVLGEIKGQIPWCAVSVDIDENTGNAWVVVRAHPQVKGSKDEIWIVNKAVDIVKRIEIDEMCPLCVSVDSKNKVAWIGCPSTTLRYTTEGEKLASARHFASHSVVHGLTKDDVFIAAGSEDYVDHLKIREDETVEIKEIGDDFGESQKWLAWVPFSDAKLTGTVAFRLDGETAGEVLIDEGNREVAFVGENDPMRDILMRRYEILRRKLIETERQYESGVAGVDQVYQAKIRLFQVGSELVETPAERIDFLEHILSIYQEQMKVAELRLASGRGAASDVDDIKLLMLEVQQQIVQAEESLKQDSVVSDASRPFHSKERVQNVTFDEGLLLVDALRMVSAMYKVNIIPSETILKDPYLYVPVTNLYDVTFEEILKAVCGTTHTYVEQDGLIYVYRNNEYERLTKRLTLSQAQQAVAAHWAQNSNIKKFVPLKWGKMLDRDDGTQALQCKFDIFYWQQDQKEVYEMMFFFDEAGKVREFINLTGNQSADVEDSGLTKPIDFEITSHDFRQGDSIEIAEISGSSETLEVGQTYTVKGRYTLASEDAAALHVYATNGETRSQQGPIVQRGSGEFTRTFTFLEPGDLHLSFYPAQGGSGFGGVYFAQKGTTPQPEGPVDIAPADFKLRYDEKRKTFNLVVSIQNTGEVTIPQHRVRYYRGDPADDLDETGNPHSGWHNAGPIEPGKIWNECTRDFFLPDGGYTFTVILDYNQAVKEIDESNNQRTIHVNIQNGRIINQSLVYSPESLAVTILKGV